MDYLDYMDYFDHVYSQESSSESDITDSFITSDSEEDELTWDSGDSRPAGPSPPSTPRVMDNTPQPDNGRRRLRPRPLVEFPSSESTAFSSQSQILTEEPESMEQGGDSDTDSDVTVADEPNLSDAANVPAPPPLNNNLAAPVHPLDAPGPALSPAPHSISSRSSSPEIYQALDHESDLSSHSPSPPPPASPPQPHPVLPPSQPQPVLPPPQPQPVLPPPQPQPVLPPPQPQPVLPPPQPQPAVGNSAQPTTSTVTASVAPLNDSVLSEGEDGSYCTICMDPLTNSGSHRVACLKCGHIFGQSCVERWIKVGCNNGAKRCPTCNKRACLKDIRILFFSKVVPLDTVEKNRLIEEKEMMSSQKKGMEMELNRCKLQCEMNRKRYEKRIAELEQQYAEAIELLSKGGKVATSAQKEAEIQGLRADLLHNIELSKEGGCRVLAYCPVMKDMVVSQPSGNTVFAGFGVRVLNTVDFQPVKFVFLHNKMIRDLAFHPEDRGILLSVSLDQTAKLVDLNSRCTIHSFKCDGPLWSCCWDATNPHLLLVGTQVGKVFQFDRRMVDTHVNLWEDKPTTPVVALASVPSMPSTPFPQGGFFSCRLNSVYSYVRSSETYKSQLLPIEGPFMSMKYNLASQTLLTKTRPSSRCPNSMINMNLVDTDGQNKICLPQIHSYSCGSFAPALTRFTLMPHDNDTLVVGHHQSARTVNLWSTKTGDLKHSFPVREPVLDITTINQSANQCLLATLSEKQLSIYKVV